MPASGPRETSRETGSAGSTSRGAWSTKPATFSRGPGASTPATSSSSAWAGRRSVARCCGRRSAATAWSCSTPPTRRRSTAPTSGTPSSSCRRSRGRHSKWTACCPTSGSAGPSRGATPPSPTRVRRWPHSPPNEASIACSPTRPTSAAVIRCCRTSGWCPPPSWASTSPACAMPPSSPTRRTACAWAWPWAKPPSKAVTRSASSFPSTSVPLGSGSSS